MFARNINQYADDKGEASLNMNSKPSSNITGNSSGNSDEMFTWEGHINNLNQALQTIVDDINKKRKQDETLLEEFRKALDVQMSKNHQTIEDALFEQYETTNTSMQKKLQELSKIMDHITLLETELVEFRQALKSLFQDFQRDSSLFSE